MALLSDVLHRHPLPRRLFRSISGAIPECPSAAITQIIRSQLGGAAPPGGLSAALRSTW
ncbi:hypothetical protein PF003_g3905 [Phytophthora fragariae]|nr:hypothetical protein PF003_g3905 [Phytophthora fragariae]